MMVFIHLDAAETLVKNAYFRFYGNPSSISCLMAMETLLWRHIPEAENVIMADPNRKEIIGTVPSCTKTVTSQLGLGKLVPL